MCWSTRGETAHCGRRFWAHLAVLALYTGYAAFFSPATYADLTPGLHEGLALEHDGEERTYDVYVPSSYTGNVPVPLIVDLHGFGASASAQRGVSGFDRLADSNGFVVAYPEGVGGSWNDRIIFRASRDDVGFLEALVATVNEEANIDLRRVYATGWSNGGGMTTRLACRATDRFAAFATFAGGIPSDWTEDDCPASRPFSMIQFRGLTDETIPYDGGVVFGTNAAGAVPTFTFFRRLNECGSAQPDVTSNPGNSTECQLDTSCAEGVQIQFCSTQSNVMSGHNLYRNVDGINLSAMAWDFMSQFELPESTNQFEINFGLTGGWFNPETAGQGLLLEVLPGSQQVFVTWFTYETEGASAGKIGSTDHRWLSGLGSIDGNRVEIDLTVTSGGFFDDPTDVQRTEAGTYGTLELEFQDCENATMTYDIISEGLTGSRSLIRLSTPPQTCLDAAAER